ncbi:predicted protein [Chaetomium globosum CBS 148.51]|uniref:Uncharacterized protein n=1 Tax=Chaetomium globosum (strain ATCC 6205 / CBS 148.51 / DSM 1962 / NBRC 6347 / NRRL 1970) TaxID=306901 RepID=Q2GUP4_CHAGB|nr:uncharacterized protein CHGG_08310 [Chaetomium globosum CBS 148.51]EAQ87057.1 predicted protein [Chaetomium globosum CBS 148.51]
MDGDDPVEPSAGRSGAPATSNCRCYGTSSKVFCHLGIISTIGVERAPAVIGQPPAAAVTIAGVPNASPAAKPDQVTYMQRIGAEPARCSWQLTARGVERGEGVVVRCQQA